MNVYTVEQGEQGMGGSVAGVYATQAVAIEAAQRIVERDGEYTRRSATEWDAYGDYVRVVERPVVGELNNPVRYMMDRLPGSRARLHSVRVGQTFPAGTTARTAGYLHDVVEDGGVTVADIRERFGDDVARVVNAVTRRKGEVYADFIERAGRDRLGRAVKLADLQDNLRDLPEGTLRERYLRAVDVLSKI